MKNLTKLIIFLSVGCLMAFWGCQPSQGPWVELDQPDTLGGISSYNKTEIKKSGGRIQVNVRTVYYGESRDYITNLFGKKYEKFAYVINLEELNCAKKEFQILSTALYDTRHQLLHTQNYESENWEEIPSGSDIAELAQAVCK